MDSAGSGVVQRRMVGPLAVDLYLGDDGFAVPVDVDVQTELGEVLHGTFLTLDMIERQMASYGLSGECADGLYFWCASPVVVRELNESVILRAIAELDRSGELRSALESSFPDATDE